MKKSSFIIFTCVIFLFVTSAQSHHGRSNFRYDKTVTVEGKVNKINWRNPHVYLDVLVTNKNNSEETWLIEAGTPSRLKRQGWEKNSAELGDTIIISGFPDRDPEKKFLYVEYIIFNNGEKLILEHRFRPTSPENEKKLSINKPIMTPSQDYSGTWMHGPNTSLTGQYFVPPVDWPLTELGEAQLASFNEHDNPAYDCLDRGLPYFAVMPYWLAWTRFEYQIEVDLQNIDISRTLYLNQETHPDDLEPSLVGHSIAHIDKNGSLLVDTVGFSATRWGLAPGIDSSKQKRVSERYALSEDGLGMDVSITFEDPIYLTEPVTVNGTYRKMADTLFEPYECDLEAARRSISPLPNSPSTDNPNFR